MSYWGPTLLIFGGFIALKLMKARKKLGPEMEPRPPPARAR